MNAKNSTRTRRWLSRLFNSAKAIGLAGVVATGVTGVALGQDSGFTSPGGVDPNTSSVDQALASGYSPGVGSQYPVAATYEESVLTGQGSRFAGAGAMFQGIGQANYLTAQANVANEQARSMYFDNAVKHAETYWQRKAIYEQGRQLARGQRSTAEQLVARARASAPAGLTVGQFDSTTGALVWPEALMNPEFADEREAIEIIVKRDGIGHRNVEAISERMTAILQTKVRALDSDDYLSAKKFLTGLAVESSETPSRAESLAKSRTLSGSVARR